MIPSRKTILNRLYWLDKLRDLTPEQAATIVRQAMEYGEGDMAKPTLQKYIFSIRLGHRWSMVSDIDRAFHIMDAALETHGSEFILARGDDPGYTFSGLQYLNTGDPYTPTVIYDHGKGKWEIAAWGDLVEWDEERFGEGEVW